MFTSGFIDIGMADEAPHAQAVVFGFDGNQLRGNLFAEKCSESFEKGISRREVVEDFAVVAQCHRQAWIGKGDAGELFCDVREFCATGFEELTPDWCVQEEFADFDLSTRWATADLWGVVFTGDDVELHAMVGGGASCFNTEV